MAVIGFLDYQDFIDELAIARQNGHQPLVRMNEYTRDLGGSPVGYAAYLVEVASTISLDVLVCRFRVGMAMEYDKERRRELTEDGHLVAELVNADLAQRDYPVRAGLIAAAAESNINTARGDLYHYRDRRVVAGPAPEE